MCGAFPQQSIEQLTDIGASKGLNYTQLKIFCEYIRVRGFDTSSQGYIEEWASRFANGSAYTNSDLTGRGILDALLLKHVPADEVDTWKASQSN